jgi:hypothetical protein
MLLPLQIGGTDDSVQSVSDEQIDGCVGVRRPVEADTSLHMIYKGRNGCCVPCTVHTEGAFLVGEAAAA